MAKSTKSQSFSRWVKTHISEITVYGGLLFCIILFSILTPLFGESIWSITKMSTLISDVIVLALMSVGAIFVYALGSMDISIGKQVGLYATLMVIIGNKTDSLLLGIIIATILALIIGVINGATGELLHIHPIMTSLVVMMILSGISSIMYTNLGSRNIALRTINSSIFKDTGVMLLTLVVEICIITYLFKYTVIGKNVKAIGANPIAAEQSGINLVKYRSIAYVIMGVCIVIASLFQMGYTGSASDSTGTG